MITQVSAVIFFITCLSFFGWQFLRKILRQNEVYLTAPSSVILGTSAFVLLSNIFAYFFSVSNSFLITIVLMFVSGLFLYFKENKDDLVLGIEKKYLLYLILISISLASVYTFIFFTNDVFDEGIHRIYALSMANDNFPVRDPFNFDYSVQYHYGFNMLVAGISLLSGLSIIRSVDIGMLFIIFPVFWMVFSLVYRMTKNYKAGFLSAWLFFFGGGFRYLSVFGHLDYSQKYLTDYFKQIADIFFSNIPNSGILGPGYFHPYSIDTYGNLLYHPPTAMAMPIVLMIVWFLYKRKSFSGNKNIINTLIGSLIGLTALVSEDKFLIIISSLFIFALWEIYSQGARKIKDFVSEFFSQYGTIFFVSIFVSIFQGGVLSDMFFGLIGYSKLRLVESIAGVSAVSVRMVPGIISTSGFYPFSELYSWIFLVTEWGIPILFFPSILYFIYKKRDKEQYIFALMILIGFVVSFVFNYSAWPAVFYRFAATSYILLEIPLGIFLVDWSKDSKWKKGVVCASVVLMAISPVMFSLKAIQVKPSLHQLSYNKSEIFISEIVKNTTNNNSIILSRDPRIVSELFGRYAYETDKKTWNTGSNPFVGYLDKINIGELRDRKIGYIYADPEFLKKFKDGFLKNNLNFLEEVYNLDNEYILYKIK